MADLLFTPEHADWILFGSPHTNQPKTETRRYWKRWRVKEGGLYYVTTRLFKPEKRFAQIIIRKRWREPLREISDESVRREGYANKEEYRTILLELNPLHHGSNGDWWPLYVIRFDVILPIFEGRRKP